MKLPYKLEFVGKDNMAAIDVVNGKRKLIAQFDEKGLFVTDDAETAVRLEKKNIPYHKYNEKKGKTSPKAQNAKEDKQDEKNPFD